MTYPGGKNAHGVYQTLINLMPRHKLYVEPFLGGGAIYLAKKRAAFSVLADPDLDALNNFLDTKLGIAPIASDTDEDGRYEYPRLDAETPTTGLRLDFGRDEVSPDSVAQIHVAEWPDTFTVVKKIWEVFNSVPPSDCLIFADPPYLASACSPGRPLYKFDMTFESQHVEFLTEFKKLPCMRMVTHYECELYNDMLAGWRKVHFNNSTRGGWKIDTCYLSFPEPTELHDYRYLGKNFRQREKIKLRTATMRRRIENMTLMERSMFFEAVDEYRRSRTS